MRVKNYSIGAGEMLNLGQSDKLTYRIRGATVNGGGGSGHNRGEDEESVEEERKDYHNDGVSGDEEIGYDSFLRPMQQKNHYN